MELDSLREVLDNLEDEAIEATPKKSKKGTDTLSSIILTNTNSNISIQAASLWKPAPTLLIIVRRPGCVVCRGEVLEFASRRELFKTFGVNIVLIVHQLEGLDELLEQYWGEKDTCYLDEKRSFYKALGYSIFNQDPALILFRNCFLMLLIL